jgi:hypothetical protein
MTDSMQVVLRVPLFGRAVPQRTEAVRQGQDHRQQQGKPDVVRGQWLRQNRKYLIHNEPP